MDINAAFELAYNLPMSQHWCGASQAFTPCSRSKEASSARLSVHSVQMQKAARDAIRVNARESRDESCLMKQDPPLRDQHHCFMESKCHDLRSS